MATKLRCLRNTHLRLSNMGCVNGFLYQKLLRCAACFWASVTTLFFALFGFLNINMLRVKESERSQPSNSDCVKLDSNCIGEEGKFKKQEVDDTELKETKEIDDLEETESPKFFFKFQFQTYREEDESVGSNSVPFTSANKYEFLSGKDFSHYLEEPEVVSLCVNELYADCNNGFVGEKESVNKEFLLHENFTQKAKEESVHEVIEEKSGDSLQREEEAKKLEAKASIGDETKQLEVETFDEVEIKKLEPETFNEGVTSKLEPETFIEKSFSEKKEIVDVEDNTSSNQDVLRDDGEFLSEKDFIASDSDSDSVTSSHEFVRRFIASTSDGFLSDKDFDETFELDNLMSFSEEKVESTDEDLELDYMNLQNSSSGYDANYFDEEDVDVMEELKKMEEESNMENSGNEHSENLPMKDFEDNNNSKLGEPSCSDNEPREKDNSEKSNPENWSAWDSEDSNGLETLWEHQDLIEQLKMELKKARATGLPTILEEDECPKIMEDLKPWKIEEKFQVEDKMSELHKFYRSYRERMRKFDILNYQKMCAMGFLQSKDPLQSMPSQKASAPALTSLLSQRYLLSKRKKSSSDPMMSFIKELHGDLEIVYVGQMCLSWEILHWQYEKALELWDSDPYGMRRYNQVAGEFQQFQVLVQRFIENEPFEGPRVQNYVKQRCVLRNLLQVPVLREDSMKDKKARRKGKDDYTITSDMLVEILEESIRVFWRFVRADKDAHNVIQKGRKGTQVEPQDPTELELLTEVRRSLQKKEKKLKEILRSGNCILKKFQKHREDSSDQVLYFFSQVDMKLVARVLNMSKVTADQLLWCHNKLSKINFVSRKIQVEPSFLLFPCS